MNISRELLKIAKDLVAGKKLKVYRVGRGTSLENRNAADLAGMAGFISDAEDYESSITLRDTDTLTEYTVEVEGGFGRYNQYRDGRSEDGDGRVGVEKHSGGLWYSFPEGGSWRLLKVGKSVPIGKILKGNDGTTLEIWWSWKIPSSERVKHLKKFF